MYRIAIKLQVYVKLQARKMFLPDVTEQSSSYLNTQYGEFQMLGFEGKDSQSLIIALVVGNPADLTWPLVRLQSKCTTSEVFGSLQCDCREELEYSMKLMQHEGNGIIIYLESQEARGNGLAAKLQIYEKMQSENLSSDEACERLKLPVDKREYDEAVSILMYKFGLRQVRLLTNNPDKIKALQEAGIEVQHELIPVEPNIYDYEYLLEKQRRHNHEIPSLNSLALS